ncbi:GntR family transcriptional regulator [Tropicimonas sp. TH_r6]|uniref:GntR family transcriptional regulator n=1 Tax=Tropicimonas sp. TH_r6 TaxID=3082085 RepID=UPI002952C980|nr:GntR family transcriptional regulator [Tropicimonas sp. TH_r6]MDV7144245.1 GntR family transcriptional regulator [Tropicimonas sp. TH_r6]
MPRSNAVFKESYNRALAHLEQAGPGANLPSETGFAERWGISRTTVRAILERLQSQGLIEWEGRHKKVLRRPERAEYFCEEETRTPAEKVEQRFMEHVVGGDLAPGTVLRESELAREFGASPSAVREFLIRFSRFGLIEKQPNRHWILRGFTRDFAVELFNVREMFELRAFEALLAEPPASPARTEFVAMAPEFQRILDDIESAYLDFPRLDERFHHIPLDLLGNRFIDDFFQVVSMIFHFHYRWNKAGEMDRNRDACREHLAIISAIRAGDTDLAQARFREHLASARRTLLLSIQWDNAPD